MGWLNSERPPAKYNAAYFKMLVEKIRTAVNFIDSSNFPKGLQGSLLNDKSVPLTKLGQGEWRIPIIGLATPYTTTSTTLVNVGQYIFWTPMSFPSSAKVYLEITGSSGNSANVATFTLWGKDGIGNDLQLAELTTNTGNYECIRSEKMTMPTSNQGLLLKMKSGSTSYNAGILGANLVIIL